MYDLFEAEAHRCLEADLTQRLELECVVLQESDALCLAERHYGLARGVDDFAMLDASTGIGLGVLTGSRLLENNKQRLLSDMIPGCQG